MKEDLPWILDETNEYKLDLEKQLNNNAAYLR
jgi:hypothetical protein